MVLSSLETWFAQVGGTSLQFQISESADQLESWNQPAMIEKSRNKFKASFALSGHTITSTETPHQVAP